MNCKLNKMIYFGRGCGYTDNCKTDELCNDKNKTTGDFECVKMGMI